MLTQDQLHEFFDYSPDTGIFIRRKRLGNQKSGTVVGCLAQGYYRVRVNYKLYLLHRLIWLYVYGELPEFIDHINRISTDNRIGNLRSVTKKQNQENREKQRNNKSGFKGVSWDKSRKKWFVCINNYGKTIPLGRFDNVTMASKAYEKAALRLHSHSNVKPMESKNGFDIEF